MVTRMFGNECTQAESLRFCNVIVFIVYVVLFSVLSLQLADFGLSNNFQTGSLLQTYCGSPLYAAPEIVKGLPYTGPEVGQSASWPETPVTGNVISVG